MFTALVDNELVNFDPRITDPINPTDKRQLHAGKPQVRCRGCDAPSHIRLVQDTPDPFMVFAHNPGQAEHCKALGYHTDESFEHHELKSRLAAATRTAGWTTDTEVFGEHCRADVVATNPRNGTRRVLEAQISRIRPSDVHERTERYIHHFGGRVTWTHHGARTWANRAPDVEALQINDELDIVVDGVAADQTGTKAQPAPLETIVGQILTQRLRYVWLTDIGFYLDLAASVTETRRQHPGRTHRGKAVRECDQAGPLTTALDGRPICLVCELPFIYRQEDNQPAPVICGRIHCRQIHGYTDEHWAGQARMANARLAAGVPLNEVDHLALLKTVDT